MGSKAQALGKAGPGYFKCMPGSRANFVEVDLFKYFPLHKEPQNFHQPKSTSFRVQGLVIYRDMGVSLLPHCGKKKLCVA